MKKVIIFERIDKTLHIASLTQNAYDLGLNYVGTQITPSGLPFWIVDESKIPANRSNRDAWELDGTQGGTDGYGE